MSRWFVRLIRIAGLGVLALLLLWVVGAVAYAGIGPRLLRQVLAGALLLGFPVAWVGSSNRRRISAMFVVVTIAVIGLWQLKRPAIDRAWTADMQRPAVIEFAGDTVTIRGIRDLRYRTPDDFDLQYYDAQFDLRGLRSIDFMVERFHPWRGLAHTLLSFGFDGGAYVCISAEIRREVGEHFHPLAGLYREYELLYVIGSERDLIGLRTNYRRSRVWLYPIKTTPERRRALFVDMLRRAASLAETPEFYNTVLSSCTTNIVDHVRALVPGRVPFDWRIWVPGYSGELAYELGLIDTGLSFEQAERHFRVDRRAQAAPVEAGFSRRLRSGR